MIDLRKRRLIVEIQEFLFILRKEMSGTMNIGGDQLVRNINI